MAKVEQIFKIKRSRDPKTVTVIILALFTFFIRLFNITLQDSVVIIYFTSCASLYVIYYAVRGGNTGSKAIQRAYFIIVTILAIHGAYYDFRIFIVSTILVSILIFVVFRKYHVTNTIPVNVSLTEISIFDHKSNLLICNYILENGHVEPTQIREKYIIYDIKRYLESINLEKFSVLREDDYFVNTPDGKEKIRTKKYIVITESYKPTLEIPKGAYNYYWLNSRETQFALEAER